MLVSWGTDHRAFYVGFLCDAEYRLLFVYGCCCLAIWACAGDLEVLDWWLHLPADVAAMTDVSYHCQSVTQSGGWMVRRLAVWLVSQ